MMRSSAPGSPRRRAARPSVISPRAPLSPACMVGSTCTLSLSFDSCANGADRRRPAEQPRDESYCGTDTRRATAFSVATAALGRRYTEAALAAFLFRQRGQGRDADALQARDERAQVIHTFERGDGLL